MMTNVPSYLPLSRSQIEDFDQNGYLLLPQVLGQTQLAQLRELADKAESHALAWRKQGNITTDFVYSNTFFTTYLNRLLHFHLHAGYGSLWPMGMPEILTAVQNLCGPDFVPTVDMMIYKHNYNSAVIPWHQDLIYHSDQYRVVTAGIYLDDSNTGNGALKVIPGSQSAKQDICQIIEQPPSNIIEVSVKAGDVLLHNPMIVHSSNSMTAEHKRRTLYYEFRPMAQALGEESWPMRLLDRRLDLLYNAIAYYQQLNPEQPHFNWQIAPQWAKRQHHNVLDPLYLEPIPFNTANFCSKSMQAAK